LERTQSETYKWQAHVAGPARRRPLAPRSRQVGVQGLSDYRLLVNTIEAAVGTELGRLGINPICHLRYKAYARSVLKELRNFKEPRIHANGRESGGKGTASGRK